MLATPDAHPMANAADLLARVATRIRQLGVTNRTLHIQLLRETLESNPWCAGVWSVWQPDALGPDAPHAGAPGHDASGRCMPFWHRMEGGCLLETNQNPDAPGFGDYYQISFESRRPTAVGPYEYPVAGRTRILFSRTAPVLDRDLCLGVVGLDLCLEEETESVPSDGPAEQAGLAGLESRLGGGVMVLDAADRMLRAGPAAVKLLARESGTLPVPGKPLPKSLLAGLLPASQPGGLGKSDNLWIGSTRSPGRATEFRLLRCRHAPRSVLWIRPAPALPGGFSPREGEILDWVSEGKTNDEIALILGISTHTVKNHLLRIFRRLDVATRQSAAVAWNELKSGGTSPEGAHRKSAI